MHARFVIKQAVDKIAVLIAATHAHLGTQVEFFGLDASFFELIESLLKAVSIESRCVNLLFRVVEQVRLVTAFEYPVNLVACVRKAEAIAGVVKSSDAGVGG